MSGLLLCGKMAKKPLYIKEAGINIYSMEELCYYLYNNIYMIEPEFFDKELLNFIQNEMGLDKVAKKLKDQMFRNESYIKMMETVFEGSFYYSGREMEEIKEILYETEKKSIGERMKNKSDMLAKKGRYVSAIKGYRKLLSFSYKINDSRVIADIWNNIGVIYAKMFRYKDAYECFEMAADMTEEKEYKDNLICSAIFMDDDEALADMKKKYNIDDETVSQYKKAIAMADKKARENVEKDEAIKTFSYNPDKELTAYYKEADGIISKWKHEYREQIQ